jgi:hypothetical protein
MPVHLWWRIVLANLDDRGRQVVSSSLGLTARRRPRVENAGCDSRLTPAPGPTRPDARCASILEWGLWERDATDDRSPALLAYLEMTPYDRELIQHRCQATESELLVALQQTRHLDDFETVRELSRALRETD